MCGGVLTVVRMAVFLVSSEVVQRSRGRDIPNFSCMCTMKNYLDMQRACHCRKGVVQCEETVPISFVGVGRVDMGIAMQS